MVKRPAYTRLKQWLDKPQCTGSSPVGTTNMEYRKTNREKSKTAKKEFFWCRCDLNHVSQTNKCKVCNRRVNRSKLKNY
jgi:hypothetical protein